MKFQKGAVFRGLKELLSAIVVVAMIAAGMTTGMILARYVVGI